MNNQEPSSGNQQAKLRTCSICKEEKLGGEEKSIHTGIFSGRVLTENLQGSTINRSERTTYRDFQQHRFFVCTDCIEDGTKKTIKKNTTKFNIDAICWLGSIGIGIACWILADELGGYIWLGIALIAVLLYISFTHSGASENLTTSELRTLAREERFEKDQDTLQDAITITSHAFSPSIAQTSKGIENIYTFTPEEYQRLKL